MNWLLLRFLVSTFKTRRSLALENLALRQQLAVLQRSVRSDQRTPLPARPVDFVFADHKARKHTMAGDGA